MTHERLQGFDVPARMPLVPRYVLLVTATRNNPPSMVHVALHPALTLRVAFDAYCCGRELEVPEQFVLPYAMRNFKAKRGPDALQNLEWAQGEMTKNERRRRLLKDSLDRKIALYTGIGKDKFESEDLAGKMNV